MPDAVLMPAPPSTNRRACASMKPARRAAASASAADASGTAFMRAFSRVPRADAAVAGMLCARSTSRVQTDGETVFLLLGDERRKDHHAAAERVQLPRARHAHADPHAAARYARGRR